MRAAAARTHFLTEPFQRRNRADERDWAERQTEKKRPA